jgi:cysteine desulfurase
MHSLENLGVIVGNGSACSSKNRFSRVIEACGYKNDVLDGVIRISFSVDTTNDEVVFAAKALNETVEKLKGILK